MGTDALGGQSSGHNIYYINKIGEIETRVLVSPFLFHLSRAFHLSSSTHFSLEPRLP
jgi:hypothetical protein